MRALVLKSLGILLGLILTASQARAGTVLITEQEASLPGEHVVVGSRGITRGPRVEVVEPGETTHSPMHLALRFLPFGGAAVKVDTLRVIYLKIPEVDITPRVRRFANTVGLDVPDAEAPEGEHFIRVNITDSEDRTRSTVFVLKVTK